jgi:hypothetical protein
MTKLFRVGDLIRWCTPEECLDAIRLEVERAKREFGEGPFKVEEIVSARGIFGFPPAHGQILIVSLNGVRIEQRFSGICFRAAA